MANEAALPETDVVPGENRVEQLALIPDKPLDLAAGWLTLAELAHEEVPGATKQLLDSIRRFGLLQPILVRSTPIPNATCVLDYHYDLVDGRRRLDACRKVGIDPVPVVIAETDLAIADVATLATNATRTSNPVAEYDAIERLIHKGATIKDISGATGMAQQTIKARQRLFNLAPTLLEGFRAGQITVTVAEAAAKLPQAVQQELADTYFTESKVTMTDVHTARQARTQQAMAQMEPLDLASVKDADDSRVIPDPPEFDQANRLAQLADEIDPQQATVIRSLRWCAAILMDIATGQQKEPDAAPVQRTEIVGLPVVVAPAMPEGTWAFVSKGKDGKPYPYAMGQGIASDATPNDAPVAEPNRVFTVTKIAEPVEEEAFYEEEEPEESLVAEHEANMDTSDEEPYPAEQADDERHPGNWMNEVFER